MDIGKADLQQQAETIASGLRDAFPNVPLPAQIPLGCGYWTHDEQGCPEYHHGGDGLYIEAFFRGIEWDRLVGPTPPHTREVLRRFFIAPPPPRRWLDVVGDPLLSWEEVTSSWTFMSIPARVYYLPAYVLTALPLLVRMRFEDLPYVRGRADPVEFVVHTVAALIPPSGLQVWEALNHLPPERLDPSYRDFARLSWEEAFLRLAGQLTRPQRQVIGQFVVLTLVTHPFFSIVDPSCSDQADMDALRQCWIQPGCVLKAPS